MSTGSITDFLHHFTSELSRPNHFDVFIPVPSGLSGATDFARDLSYKCEATELPGRSLLTAPMKVYGVEEKFPYLSNYNDISLTFILEDKMTEKRFFDRWINFIHPTSTFNFKYKENYSVDLIITQYDMLKKPSYKVKLLQAFPIAMNQLDLNWASDGYHKLTVTFSYTSWEELIETANVDQSQIELQNQADITRASKTNFTIYNGVTLEQTNFGITNNE
jgi:hypothetical protein